MDPHAVHLTGAALPAAATWGEADTSTLGPTPGNGFATRWAEDLALLAEHGVTAVRVAIDWPRLQPRRAVPLDGDAVEATNAVVVEARRLGLEVWATLHEAGLPRWFDDEGGFDDADAAGRWWPRWVERAAETFGDRLDGWVPLLPTVANRRLVWRDTWGILRGGPPVTKVVTLPADVDLLHRDRDLGDIADCDRSGVVLPVSPVATPDDRRRTEDRLGEHLRTLHDVGPDRPISIADVTVAGTDRADHARGVEAARAAIDGAAADRIPVVAAFASPAVDGADLLGLFTRDREPTDATRAWLPSAS